MKILLNGLRKDRSGTAVTEFALWASLFFVVAIVALDFGGFYMQRGQINEAVSAAAVDSFQDRDNVNFSQIQNYVRNIADDQSLTVEAICNGVQNSCTNFNRTCACLRSDGTYVPSACGSTCSGSGVTAGSTAGYYLTIQASQNHEPMVLPRGILAGSALSQRATVRLQ